MMPNGIQHILPSCPKGVTGHSTLISDQVQQNHQAQDCHGMKGLQIPVAYVWNCLYTYEITTQLGHCDLWIPS